MALLSIYRGTQTEVSERPVSDGALLFATDTKKIYLDKGSSRVEMSSLQDLSDYITSTQLSSAIGAEASARQKQDQLLEQAIDDKLGADDIIAGSNVQVSHDDISGHITFSATDTKYTAGTGLGMIGNGFYLLNGGVGLNQLANDSVSEDKIIDGAVDTAKIADGAVTAEKLAAGVIPEDTNTTYTLTKSGSTITLNGSDGSSSEVTDDNTTYTLTSFGITATAEELNYTSGVTSNIQTQLNNKASTSDILNYLSLSGGTLTGTITSRNLRPAVDSIYDIGTSSIRYRNIYADNIYGTVQNAVSSADKLTTARTISLTGDVTGSTSFNGSANVSISARLAANSVTSNEIAASAVGSSELASNAVTLEKLGSDVGTVAVQSATPTDTNVKLWIQI